MARRRSRSTGRRPAGMLQRRSNYRNARNDAQTGDYASAVHHVNTAAHRELQELGSYKEMQEKGDVSQGQYRALVQQSKNRFRKTLKDLGHIVKLAAAIFLVISMTIFGISGSNITGAYIGVHANLLNPLATLFLFVAIYLYLKSEKK